MSFVIVTATMRIIDVAIEAIPIPIAVVVATRNVGIFTRFVIDVLISGTGRDGIVAVVLA